MFSLDIIEAIKSKFGKTPDELIIDGERFIANCNDGSSYDNKDISQSEIDSARENRLSAEKLEAERKASAKAALLERLGITEEEARLLLG